MVYVAVYTGLRTSELIGLRWKNVHEEGSLVATGALRRVTPATPTIAIIKTVWKRLQRIKNLTVQVRAGTEVRSYAVVKVLIIWFF